MTTRPKRELMAALRSRRQREGWVRIEVWVPEDLVQSVRNYVRRITKVTKRIITVGTAGAVECEVTDYAGRAASSAEAKK